MDSELNSMLSRLGLNLHFQDTKLKSLRQGQHKEGEKIK